MLNKHHQPKIIREVAPFKINKLTMPYAEFIPKLYNFCLSLGFRKGLIMPSRAFCSDENQGIPIMLLTKHFGTFPFNHGRVGGIVAIKRHGPHANHGEDSLLVQACHVGYDPETGVYGTCTRPRMLDEHVSASCGKITHTITPYLDQYHFARNFVFLHLDDQGNHLITVKNSLIDFDSHPVNNGIVLRLDRIAEINEEGRILPIGISSTTHTYTVSERFKERISSTGYVWKGNGGEPIGDKLSADLIFFREDLHATDDSILLERNLIEYMPIVVTAKSPALQAAKINIQLEFDRTSESIRRGSEYKNQNLLFISGLNIDISEHKDYPANTYFVPWAAHIQLQENNPKQFNFPIEQKALFSELMEKSIENPDQICLAEEFSKMLKSPRFDISSPSKKHVKSFM